MLRLALLDTVMCLAFVAKAVAILQLPFEVEEMLFNMLTPQEVAALNTTNGNTIQTIYRKDLDPGYIAYYEVKLGNKYVVVSAGPGTGDKSEVESGENPTPTEVLSDQATRVNQTCVKFYRLAPMGLYMCENGRGLPVAATFDWVNDIGEVEDWTKLKQMVQNTLADFAAAWKDVAKSKDTKTVIRLRARAGMRTKVRKPPVSSYTAEGVVPGATVRVPLEAGYNRVSLHAIPASRQRQLCAILGRSVCQKDGAVNPKLIRKLTNGITYLQLDVNADKGFIRRVLRNKELSFYVEVEMRNGERLLKYFALDLRPRRHRRSIGSWRISGVPSSRLNMLPRYDQHKVASTGCMSGCAPVAWAIVLGYFDRVATYSSSFGYNFWKCNDAGQSSTSGACKAPKQLTSYVEKYIEKIGKVLGTSCGSTYQADNKKIVNFHSISSSAKVIEILPSKVGSTMMKYLDRQIPVVLAYNYDTSTKNGHSVVVPQYRKILYSCVWTCHHTGWWLNQRKVCNWKDEYKFEYRINLGWGHSHDNWHPISESRLWSAHVLMRK